MFLPSGPGSITGSEPYEIGRGDIVHDIPGLEGRGSQLDPTQLRGGLHREIFKEKFEEHCFQEKIRGTLFRFEVKRMYGKVRCPIVGHYSRVKWTSSEATPVSIYNIYGRKQGTELRPYDIVMKVDGKASVSCVVSEERCSPAEHVEAWKRRTGREDTLKAEVTECERENIHNLVEEKNEHPQRGIWEAATLVAGMIAKGYSPLSRLASISTVPGFEDISAYSSYPIGWEGSDVPGLSFTKWFSAYQDRVIGCYDLFRRQKVMPLDMSFAHVKEVLTPVWTQAREEDRHGDARSPSPDTGAGKTLEPGYFDQRARTVESILPYAFQIQKAAKMPAWVTSLLNGVKVVLSGFYNGAGKVMGKDREKELGKEIGRPIACDALCVSLAGECIGYETILYTDDWVDCIFFQAAYEEDDEEYGTQVVDASEGFLGGRGSGSEDFPASELPPGGFPEPEPEPPNVFRSTGVTSFTQKSLFSDTSTRAGLKEEEEEQSSYPPSSVLELSQQRSPVHDVEDAAEATAIADESEMVGTEAQEETRVNWGSCLIVLQAYRNGQTCAQQGNNLQARRHGPGLRKKFNYVPSFSAKYENEINRS